MGDDEELPKPREEIKPPQPAYVSTGIYGDPLSLERATDLVGDAAEPAVSGPRNSFSLRSQPMVKMCFACAMMHRDYREGATPDDASLCPRCIAKGMPEPARFVA